MQDPRLEGRKLVLRYIRQWLEECSSYLRPKVEVVRYFTFNMGLGKCIPEFDRV